MISSPNMGLVIWNLPDDAFLSTQLGDNMAKLDQHDHSPGKGKPITTNALADQVITAEKLAPGVISTSTIADGSVTSSKLADSSILTSKIAPNAITEPLLDATVVPVGTVSQWWTPNYSLHPAPSGWVPCDGAAYTAGQHSFAVGGSITVPDLRNKFVLGAVGAGGSGTPTRTQNPSIGATGGSTQHGLNLAHSHGMVHTHSFATPSHTHGVNFEHSHNIGYLKAVNADVNSGSGFYTIYNFTGLHGNPYRVGNGQAPTTDTYPNTATSDVGSSVQSVTTDVGTRGATDSSLTTTDIRPDFVGLLFLIKIKHG